MRDKTGLYFSIFAVLLLVLFLLLGLYIVGKRTSIRPSAKGSGSGSFVSLENSYIFASPLRATVGGDLIRVTLFLLDEQGRGVADKKIVLGNNERALEISDVQNLTDENGKAIFDVGSTIAGTYFLQALADGQLLPQKVKIVFD